MISILLTKEELAVNNDRALALLVRDRIAMAPKQRAVLLEMTPEEFLNNNTDEGLTNLVRHHFEQAAA